MRTSGEIAQQDVVISMSRLMSKWIKEKGGNRKQKRKRTQSEYEEEKKKKQGVCVTLQVE